jgi:hypothetical protein
LHDVHSYSDELTIHQMLNLADPNREHPLCQHKTRISQRER